MYLRKAIHIERKQVAGLGRIFYTHLFFLKIVNINCNRLISYAASAPEKKKF